MVRKGLLIVWIILMFGTSLTALAEHTAEELVKETFGEFQHALKKEQYEIVWKRFSREFREKGSYENFVGDWDKESRELFAGFKVEHIQASDSTAVLRAKLGGMLGRILGWRIKRRFFFEFVLEDGAWRIRGIQKSSMMRRPRRGYRPEDFSELDEGTGTRIKAIQKLCAEFMQGMRDQDFHKAWECYWEGSRPSYERFLEWGFVRAAKKKEKSRRFWTTVAVLEIRILGNKATADIGWDDPIDVLLLIHTEGKWKIRDMICMDCLDFDEKMLPEFYFEPEGLEK